MGELALLYRACSYSTGIVGRSILIPAIIIGLLKTLASTRLALANFLRVRCSVRGELS